MKKLLIALLLVTCSAQAEMVEIQKTVVCAELKDLVAILERVGEKKIWLGDSPKEKSKYIFFGNAETGTWSIVQVVDKVGCLIGFGEKPDPRGAL
ncbi:hypothetical protein UFOVP58_53 [uncultured Caudovirales phage]|uniref:Uncharacterized protein n=1 Tax=uncultured Caudovirales phage TaxID=2100421 RepID=A0A6J5KUP8_9CAUD|nr:hypothetical protein UFOVP58_53 [uncultured Caudovirales phage]